VQLLTCKAVLFDLDGVLVDSRACVERHWRRWATQNRLDLDEILKVAHGRRAIETVRLVAPHLDAESEAAALEAAEAVDTVGVVEVSGAAGLLRSIPQGRWAIVTSGTRATATTRLRHTRLPIPEVLVSGEDVVEGKPDPDGYRLAAERLCTAPATCVVIEDAPAGIAAARGAGMRVVGVATTYEPGELAEASIVTNRLENIRISLTRDHSTEESRIAIHVDR
jgi:sugar-phosphatase